MTNLPTVTVVAVTTKDYGPTIAALLKTLEQINPLEVLYFSDVEFQHERIKWARIPRFTSVEDYNRFIFKEVVDYIESDHLLVVQHDGYVLNGEAWDDVWLDYDYIGAPWTYTDGRNVGNGGFSLRSKRLHQILQETEFEYFSPEDEKICRYYRQTLQSRGIRFAPDHVAHKFSFEMHPPTCKTFGFHNYFHEPYREPIILKRTGAMGDVIMLEPVMEWFFKQGYRVVLDTHRSYFNLFAKHFYPIEHTQDIDPMSIANARVINFDMAYETEPRKIALASYFKIAGIRDVLRNPRLNFTPSADVKLFDKYIVLHTDDTAMPHRNIHGVDWDEVVAYIQVFLGYPVFRVGRGNGQGGVRVNTYSENMLAYIISGADFFIGLDSGPAQIAVACGVKSMLFFGSVNPELRYPERGKITVMQNQCPAQKDGCYHDVVSTVGQDCQVDVRTPPCIKFSTGLVKDAIKKFVE